MKPLLVLGKVFLIGCLWSLFFIEGIRVVLLINWHFDIFWPPHWAYLWSLWHSGWVIDHAKEWAFILILLAAVPMWLTGWIFLSVINWHKLFDYTIMIPIRKLKVYLNDKNAPILNDLAVKKVVKKKSYKEIRPSLQISPTVEEPYDAHTITTPANPIEANASSYTSQSPYSSVPTARTPSEPKAKAPEERKPFTHSVFDFDDDDDDFDLDFDYAVKSIQKQGTASPDSSFQNNSDNFDTDNSYEEKSERQNHRRNASQRNHTFDDFNSIDIDDDDDFEPNRSQRNKGRKNIEDDDFIEDFTPRRQETKRNRRADRGERNERRNNSSRRSEGSNNPIVETLRQKGYEIISGISIKNTYIDYIAVAKNIIYLCLVDKESGDWLADEERFNDEEPLWFSESSHRISPVRLVDIARNRLAKKLADSNITYDLRAFVIIQNGNIINAEDMFEVWRGLDVDVTRINRGSPRELPLFSKSIEEIEERIDSVRFENLKKLIKGVD